MYGSRFFFHIIKTPPYILFFVKVRSGSRRSSELRIDLYLVSNMVVAIARSDWNSHGSERKIKSGSYFSHIAGHIFLESTTPLLGQKKNAKRSSVILEYVAHDANCLIP